MKENIFQKSFTEEFIVHLSDTSCYGMAFYLSYHKWIASTKEKFFIKNVPQFTQMFSNEGIKLIVLENYLKIYRELNLHEVVKVNLVCSEIKRIKVKLNYQLLNSENLLVAEGYDQIAFVDSFGKPIMLPDKIMFALKKILVDL